VTTNLSRLLPTALKLLAAGYLDRVIVGDDADWGAPLVALEPVIESDAASAIARPMPRLDPVIRATFPFNANSARPRSVSMVGSVSKSGPFPSPGPARWNHSL
jgi:hypothetical protein